MDSLLIKKLSSPPFIRLPVTDYISCSKLMKVNNEAVAVLETCISKNSSMWTEIEILEKAIFKMKWKWKLEPLFRGIKQVLKCMLILKSENLLTAILEALDSVLGLDGKTLVPSQQYLEYLLIKIIGVGRLAVQTIDYCVYSQSKLMGKIKIGHVLNSVMPFTSFISRIWVLCHTLLIQISKCYESIYSLHLLATAAEYTWLPDNVTLPERFPFDVKSIIDRSSAKPNRCGTSESFRGTPKNQPVSEDTHDSQAKPLRPKSSTVAEDRASADLDLGVVISRESFQKSLSQARKVEEKNKVKIKKRKLKANDNNAHGSQTDTQAPTKKLKVKTSLEKRQSAENMDERKQPFKATDVHSVQLPVSLKKKIKKKGSESSINSNTKINKKQKKKKIKSIQIDTKAVAPIKKHCQIPGKQSKRQR